jgi:DNA-binding GntR family transcriptional regulator
MPAVAARKAPPATAPREPAGRGGHAPSSPDLVVAAIKHGILLGRLVPGQRLVEADLTRDHKLSRGPVREALKRLAAEGVVTLSPHRGALVRLMTRREMIELLYVLQAVIGLAVRLASLRMKKMEARSRLKRAYEKLSEHGPSGDRALQSIDRNAFYDAIFEIAGNRELARVHPVVPTQILRMQVYPYISAEDRQQQFADYKLLYDALRAGRGREAQRIVLSHTRRSRLQIKRLPDEAFAPEPEAAS